jgi:hypothetical protein
VVDDLLAEILSYPAADHKPECEVYFKRDPHRASPHFRFSVIRARPIQRNNTGEQSGQFEVPARSPVFIAAAQFQTTRLGKPPPGLRSATALFHIHDRPKVEEGDPGSDFRQDRPSVVLYNFSINGQGAIHDR